MSKAKPRIIEVDEILERLPIEQLVFFGKLRKNQEGWQRFCDFVHDEISIQKDRVYRLRRKGGLDGIIDQARDHEYYCGRVAALTILLQLAENADDEVERRERKAG